MQKIATVFQKQTLFPSEFRGEFAKNMTIPHKLLFNIKPVEPANETKQHLQHLQHLNCPHCFSMGQKICTLVGNGPIFLLGHLGHESHHQTLRPVHFWSQNSNSVAGQCPSANLSILPKFLHHKNSYRFLQVWNLDISCPIDVFFQLLKFLDQLQFQLSCLPIWPERNLEYVSWWLTSIRKTEWVPWNELQLLLVKLLDSKHRRNPEKMGLRKYGAKIQIKQKNCSPLLLSCHRTGHFSDDICRLLSFTFIANICLQPTAAATRISAPTLSGVRTLSKMTVIGIESWFSWLFSILSLISFRSNVAEIINKRFITSAITTLHVGLILKLYFYP